MILCSYHRLCLLTKGSNVTMCVCVIGWDVYITIATHGTIGGMYIN